MTEKMSFETQLKSLQTIVEQLEQGDVPLEEALKQFKTGVELSQELQKTLDNAEKTLTKLMDDDGNETLFEQSKKIESKPEDDE
ncbi:exodeoxyribonuclease VII small subunit [Paucilactobacillus wasatchensis]|uniref:Exodeoxyribonuclease 7 small subunit n=1 Tax=Paucilactobacillus wasatchensis TaxID=1335616 RepID=A0A0D0Y590_9LACO|nr:exodeoxyribonuclease VII small subunit [Paucilactobacillus wasatchensis]KIS03458.1 Exodeoxyribonuclease VII small subunit [Paucilactobacillus wasatchensis]